MLIHWSKLITGGESVFQSDLLVIFPVWNNQWSFNMLSTVQDGRCFWPCLVTWASWSPPGRTASSVTPSGHQNAPDGRKALETNYRRAGLKSASSQFKSLSGTASPWWECTICPVLGGCRQEGVVAVGGVWWAHPLPLALWPQHLWFFRDVPLPLCTPSAPNAPTHHSRETVHCLLIKCVCWLSFCWPPCVWFPQGPGLRSKKHPLWATCVWVKDLLRDPWTQHKIKVFIRCVAARWSQNTALSQRLDYFILR